MFSVLVSANSEAWEAVHGYSMSTSRFKESSEGESQEVFAGDRKSLSTLNGTYAVLMYEDIEHFAHRDVVRVGRLKNVRTVGNEIAFELIEVGHVTYADIKELRLQLALEQGEFNRTHWAIKDGDIPSELLNRAERILVQPLSAITAAGENSTAGVLNARLSDVTELARNKIFISYSQDDKKWLDRFMKMLAPLVRNNSVDVWYDGKIKPSQTWRKEIDDAMASASVGVLLVSKDFLASEFINKNELPYLLGAAKQRGVTILWVNVAPSMYEETPLKDIQAVNSANRPWNKLKGAALDDALKHAAKAVKAAVASV